MAPTAAVAARLAEPILALAVIAVAVLSLHPAVAVLLTLTKKIVFQTRSIPFGLLFPSARMLIITISSLSAYCSLEHLPGAKRPLQITLSVRMHVCMCAFSNDNLI